MTALEILLIGAVLTVGLGWQGHLLFVKDDWRAGEPPKRLIVPGGIGFLVFVGWSAWGILRLLDPLVASYDFLDFLATSGKAFLFFLGLSAKAVFGPTYVAIALATIIYYGFEHGVFNPVDLTAALLKLVFEPCPQWLKYVYSAITCLYAFGMSVHAELVD